MKLKSLLITVAKAEDGYIEEWLEYHLKLGFDKICIGLNDWNYVLPSCFSSERVELIPMDGVKWNPHFAQSDFFTKIKDTKGLEFDVVAGYDVDEFLVPAHPDRFQDFLSDAIRRPVSFVRWRIFGDNGLSEMPTADNLSVLKRFTKCAKELHPNGKSFISMRCNGKHLRWWNPHFVCMKESGVTIREDVFTAELFHFRNKTFNERVARDMRGVKFERGDFYTSASPRFIKLFNNYNKNEVSNFKARDFLYS